MSEQLSSLLLLLPQPHVRAAAVACLNAWHAELTLTPFVEQELISTALATENPNLRAEVCVCVCVWGGGGG